MARLEALKELAAKVKAGAYRPYEIEEAAFNVWTERRNGHPRRYFASSAMKAYEGSRDAAKALRSSLLPEWGMEAHVSDGWVSVVLFMDGQDDYMDDAVAMGTDNEARVELWAILNALIAQEEAR